MARVKECYEIRINGKQMLIQVTRTERKKERNTDGSLNVEKWCEIIDNIMKKYFNTDKWEFIMDDEDKTINIKLKI